MLSLLSVGLVATAATESRQKDLLFSAITKSDAETLSSMAAEFERTNRTIRDVYSPDVIEAILGGGESPEHSANPLDVFTETEHTAVEKIEMLENLQWQVDQVDNGIEFASRGGLDHLSRILTRTHALQHLFDSEHALRLAGRVFSAAAQNNEQSQAIIFQQRPDILKEFSLALKLDTPWIVNAASALIRRSPEVALTAEAVEAEGDFKRKLQSLCQDPAASEWMRVKAERLGDIGNIYLEL